MYISKALLDGLKILGFDRETIKESAHEKHLEEIFLSTLFLNYLIVLIVYMIGVMIGGYSIAGRELNMPVFFGILMIYPFAYNLLVYFVYGFFGLMAEVLDKRKHIKPLISVGFHTAIVYTIVFYFIGLLSTFDTTYGIFLTSVFVIYFLYTMFLAISTIYSFSLPQTLIVLFIPLLILGIILLAIAFFFPEIIKIILTRVLV